MKKLFLFAVMAAAAFTAQAQNIQLHYDFGRNIYTGEEANRQKVTVTLEQFKADQWGSWYYFVDVDLSRHFTESAYTEISREINLGKDLPFVAVSSRLASSVAPITDTPLTSQRLGLYSSCISSTSRATTILILMPAPSSLAYGA